MDSFVSRLFAPTCMNLPLTITLRLLSLKQDQFFREGIIFGATIISVPLCGQLVVSSVVLDRLLRQDNFNSLELGFNYQAKVSELLKFIFIDSCSVMVTCHITSLLYLT